MTQTMVEHEQTTPVTSTAVTEHLERLATFPDELSSLLRNQPAEALTFRPSDESWSISEILGHLIVFGANWGNRIRQMLSADAVHFVPMDADDAVQRFGFQQQQADDLLAGFAARRAERVTYLRSLDADQLVRTGTHPEQGTFSVGDAIALFADNDTRRHRQIVANLRTYHEAQSVARPKP